MAGPIEKVTDALTEIRKKQPFQGTSPKTRAALIESGAMHPDDFTGGPQPGAPTPAPAAAPPAAPVAKVNPGAAKVQSVQKIEGPSAADLEARRKAFWNKK